VSRDEFIEYFEWDRAAAAAASAAAASGPEPESPTTPNASSPTTSAASSPATSPGTSPATNPRGPRPAGFIPSHLVSVKNLEKVFDIVNIEATGRMKLRTFMKALGQVPKIGRLLDKVGRCRLTPGCDRVECQRLKLNMMNRFQTLLSIWNCALQQGC